MRAIRAAAAAALLAPLATAALLGSAAPAAADDPGFGPADLGPADLGLLKDELLGDEPLANAPAANRPGKEGDAAPKDDGGGTGHNNITSFGFSVTPSTVAPGGTVTLKADGCQVPTVKVESGVFDTVTLNEGHQGTATVDFDAKVGAQYEITFDCKGERGTTTLTIADGGGHKPAPTTGPHKGVKAGFGGGASGGGDGGVGATEAVTGGVLIAGALGAAVVLMRRREPSGS
ncbi:hypothetical protein ACF09L_27900 [Streptomyces sp. NPDC014779]|uniref:hypothetical protein n=1 Tax=unclassified Streptomyces TaxID=2593676 RepID=UPI0036F76E3A